MQSICDRLWENPAYGNGARTLFKIKFYMTIRLRLRRTRQTPSDYDLFNKQSPYS